MASSCLICHDYLSQTLMNESNVGADGGISGGDDWEIVATQCGHVFHKHCLLEWSQKQTRMGGGFLNCPLCREVINMGNLQRLFLNSISLVSASEAYMRQELLSRKDQILSMETAMRELREKLKEGENKLERSRSEVQRQKMEIERLKSDMRFQEAKISGYAAFSNNLVMKYGRLRSKLQNLLKSSDDEDETAGFPSSILERDAQVDANNNRVPLGANGISDEETRKLDPNGNWIPSKSVRFSTESQMRDQKTRTCSPKTEIVPKTTDINGFSLELYDLKKSIERFGVQEVVNELKPLVELESQQSRHGHRNRVANPRAYSAIETSLLLAIADQMKHMESLSFLRQDSIILTQERSWLAELRQVHQKLYPTAPRNSGIPLANN